MIEPILLTLACIASIWFAGKCFDRDNFALFTFALLLLGVFVLWFVISVCEVISCATL